MIRIYADFNAMDEQERVRLNTAGSRADLETLEGQLTEGMTVLLYTPDELEVCAELLFDEGMWKGIPDWNTKRYLDE
jgi:hypothetical protein